MSTLPYRPEIDGLRALAIIPVVLFHLGADRLPGGFLGVDVFFVISGYLITSILQAELATDTFSFRAFWARRIRRILPAFIATIAAVPVVAFLFVFRPDRVAFAEQATAALLSLANFYFWKISGDYWGTQAEQSPLLHTWSLSVEEQFYLLYPLLLWSVFRYAPRRLPLFLAIIVVGGASLFIWAAARHPTAAFYLLPTRAWELAVGGLMAVSFSPPSDARPRSNVRGLAALAGLATILASYLLISRLGPAVIGTVVGTALLIAFGRHGPARPLLTNRAAVHLGRVAYSLYLWHWPVLVFANYFRIGWNRFLLLIPIYLLSVGSYLGIERPTRRRSQSIVAITAAYAVVLVAAVALSRTDPFYDTSAFAEAWWIPNDCNPRLEIDESSPNSVLATTRREYRRASPDAYLRGGFIFGEGDRPPEIVVLGDSHACMWSETLVRIARRHQKQISVWTMDGVNPFMTIPLDASRAEYAAGESELTADERLAYHRALLETIRTWKPHLAIVSTVWMRRAESDVDDLIEFLDGHATKTLLIEQPPVLQYRDRNVMQHLAYLGVEPDDARRHYLPFGQPAEAEQGRQLVRHLADRFPTVDYVPTWDIYTRDSEALVLDGRNVVYLDEDHLVLHGTELAAPRIEQAILESLGEAVTNRP